MIAQPALSLTIALLLPWFCLEQGDLEGAKREAASTLVEELEELVRLCTRSKSYRQRDATYRALLSVSPDHPEARRFLKYRFDQKTRTWIQGPYREPRPASERVEIELCKLREHKVRLYVDRVFEALVDKELRLGHDRTHAELEALLALDPENPRVRAHRGEVRFEVDGEVHWLARETIRARERRGRMKVRFKKLGAEVEIEPAQVLATEEMLGIDWRASSTSGRITCLATTSRSESDTVVRTLDAAWAWFPEFLGGREVELQPLRVYMMSESSERERFIERYPDLGQELRAKMRTVESAWLEDGRHFGCWQARWEVRLDMVLRQTIALYFQEAYGIDHRRGWIQQGLGLYLTQRLVGTRLSFAVTRDEQTQTGSSELARALVLPGADYFALARETLAQLDVRQLASSLGKGANAMSSVDLAASYALSAWLIETQPGPVLEEIFLRNGKGESPVEVLEEVLALELVRLREKLLRWLDENSEKDW